MSSLIEQLFLEEVRNHKNTSSKLHDAWRKIEKLEALVKKYEKTIARSALLKRLEDKRSSLPKPCCEIPLGKEQLGANFKTL